MSSEERDIPKYSELLKRTDGPPGSSWGLFGPRDELGTINFLTPRRVIEAANCIRRGAVFNLDCALDAFDPPIIPSRSTLRHTIFGNSIHQRDDYVDGFYLQCSTQVDGLRHHRHPVHGFYNGINETEIAENKDALGIHHLARRGIAGRGVLVDIEKHLAKAGKPIDQRSAYPIPVDVVDEAARAQGVEFRPGDILLLRTGWMDFYFHELSAVERAAFPSHMCSPGLRQGHETLEWIWDHQFSLCAADNFGLECYPPVADSPFADLAKVPGVIPRHIGMMHPLLIAMLGLTIGEQWFLDDLAADCAHDGVWECMVTVKPLNLVGGVGSPANALAIK